MTLSTRGFLSFVADGPAKTVYVHSDAYPSGLGFDVLQWLRSAPLDAAADAVRALRVAPETPPTAEDLERLRDYYNPHVDTLDPETYERRTHATWYQALRGTMGDPALILEAGVVEDMPEQPSSSASHYGYVADFGAGVFEAYEGCQKSPHTDGRFARTEPNEDGYYPARLVASWPLDKLPTDDEFFAAFETEGD